MMYAQVLNASGNVIHTGKQSSISHRQPAFPLFTVVKPASPQGQAFPVVLHALLNVGRSLARLCTFLLRRICLATYLVLPATLKL